MSVGDKKMQGLRFWMAVLLAVAVIAGTGKETVYAAGTIKGSITVKYGQTEARGMLSMVNALRTGSDAWYWNSGDTSKVNLTNLSELQYSYALEKVAMQRAAELALYYSHTRSDGSRCFTAYDAEGMGSGSTAENIAIGFGSASAVFTAWCEENENYAGQGHRRNMLGNFYCIGIGHAEYDGVDCWVQEFSSLRKLGTDEGAMDSTKTVTLTLDPALFSGSIISGMDQPLEIEAGTSQVLEQPIFHTYNPNYPYMDVDLQIDSGWVSSNTSVVKVNGGSAYGIAAGKASLSTSVGSNYVSVDVIVTESLANAVIKTSGDKYVYDGTEKQPSLIVTLDGKQLKENTDYTICYTDNINAGKAGVTISGKGMYSGTASASFTIAKAEQELSLQDASIVMMLGELRELQPEGAQGTLQFRSSNSSVASVDAQGRVTAKNTGKAQITITAGATQNYNETELIVGIEVKRIAAADYSGLVYFNDEYIYVKNGMPDYQFFGFVEYKDGLFLIYKGHILNTKSGLVQDPVNTADWYYMANGQAQIQYTGLADYDGEWFYVENGRLDTERGGFVEYDGSKFFVAAGQIARKQNGLTQDPVTGDWYYLAAGQVVDTVTDLAQYDDHWFYIIKGRLAEDYTGPVEYDGYIFNVVNGMVQ